jgi:hypothetical protein
MSICCFYTKHTVLRRKSKDWLALNQDNVSNLSQFHYSFHLWVSLKISTGEPKSEWFLFNANSAIFQAISWWEQVNLPKMSICCFYTKHTVLRRKSKDWLALNQDNVSEWGNMSIRGLLFRCASTPHSRRARKWYPIHLYMCYRGHSVDKS